MGKDRSVYLLLGPEEGEKSLFLGRLEKEIGSSVGGGLETNRFYPFDTDLVNVVAGLRNGSLFAGHQFSVILNAEEIRKTDVKLFVEYCKQPTKSTTLVFVSSTVKGVDRRIVNLVPKQNRKIFWELFPNQKSGWLINFFQQRGIEIEPAAARHLLDVVANNTRDLTIECDRLALFFGNGARLGMSEIEKYTYHSKDENIFTLFEKVSFRDFEGCLEVLQKILLSREADPLQIVNGVLFQFRRLLALKSLLDQRCQAKEAFLRLKILGKHNQAAYLEGSQKYSREEIECTIILIADCEHRLRSLKSDLHVILLHLLFYYAVVRGGRGAWLQGLS